MDKKGDTDVVESGGEYTQKVKKERADLNKLMVSTLYDISICGVETCELLSQFLLSIGFPGLLLLFGHNN